MTQIQKLGKKNARLRTETEKTSEYLRNKPLTTITTNHNNNMKRKILVAFTHIWHFRWLSSHFNGEEYGYSLLFAERIQNQQQQQQKHGREILERKCTTDETSRKDAFLRKFFAQIGLPPVTWCKVSNTLFFVTFDLLSFQLCR